MFKILSVVSTILFLSSCQVPKVDLFSVNDYQNVQPFSVAVGTIEVQDETTRYTELPHIETRIPITPAKALSQALTNRFRVVFPGSSNTLTFLIQEASLTQTLKESNKWYILDNIEYTLTYQLDIVYQNSEKKTENQSISGWEKQALPKRSSLADKEQTWQKMIDAMTQKVTDKIYADMPQEYKR
ncbi:MAG: hypothetical protein IKA30_04085 [Alphaproteobacteria bacterium]|nr:hypothetical protein [Alphaproteobacteria bacterium]